WAVWTGLAEQRCVYKASTRQMNAFEFCSLLPCGTGQSIATFICRACLKKRTALLPLRPEPPTDSTDEAKTSRRHDGSERDIYARLRKKFLHPFNSCRIV